MNIQWSSWKVSELTSTESTEDRAIKRFKFQCLHALNKIGLFGARCHTYRSWEILKIKVVFIQELQSFYLDGSMPDNLFCFLLADSYIYWVHLRNQTILDLGPSFCTRMMEHPQRVRSGPQRATNQHVNTLKTAAAHRGVFCFCYFVPNTFVDEEHYSG